MKLIIMKNIIEHECGFVLALPSNKMIANGEEAFEEFLNWIYILLIYLFICLLGLLKGIFGIFI